MHSGHLLLIAIGVAASFGAKASPPRIAIDAGPAAVSGAPIWTKVQLTSAERKSALSAALYLREFVNGSYSGEAIPVQIETIHGAEGLRWLMPPGKRGRRSFGLLAKSLSGETIMNTRESKTDHQFDISEGDRRVLRYNYRTIEPGDRLKAIAEPNLIYARARSDYIHPLFGLDGEELTKDWPVDHPHHRGIYWAWPEVDWHGKRGDLHALQLVFARPSGKFNVKNGPVFSEISAESTWMWEDREPIVKEIAVIRAYKADATGRWIDLSFRFNAVGDDVSLARRGTSHYGGLNIRLNSVEDQRIDFHTDPPESKPQMAWACLSGLFAGGQGDSTVTVLQNSANPDYPGDWIKYPELNWFQPTFPASGTRYVLHKGKPLVLRFRLWITHGRPGTVELLSSAWRAYNDGRFAADPP